MSRINPNHKRPRRALAHLPAARYPEARISAERVEMALRTRFDPLPSLSPQRLVQILQQFERGYLEPAARTWEAMEPERRAEAAAGAKADSATSVAGTSAESDYRRAWGNANG